MKVQSGTNDAVLARPYSGYNMGNDIVEEDDNMPTVSGYVTKNGILDFDSVNKTVYKTGISTSTESGHIKNAEVSGGECNDYGGEGIAYDMDQAGGDSGAPVYDLRDGDEEAYMVGIAVAAWNDTGNNACNTSDIYANCIGPSAYNLTDVFNGQFTAPVG